MSIISDADISKQIKAIEKKYKSVDKNITKSIEIGLKRAGINIFRDSQKIVPVDLGNLRGSGYIREDGMNTDKFSVTIGYTAEYAIYVHERLDLAHGEEYNRKHAEEIKNKTLKNRGKDQQAKFLEKAFNDNKNDIVKILEATIMERINNVK